MQAARFRSIIAGTDKVSGRSSITVRRKTAPTQLAAKAKNRTARVVTHRQGHVHIPGPDRVTTTRPSRTGDQQRRHGLAGPAGSLPWIIKHGPALNR